MWERSSGEKKYKKNKYLNDKQEKEKKKNRNNVASERTCYPTTKKNKKIKTLSNISL